MSYQQPGPQDAVPPQFQQYPPPQQPQAYPNQQGYPQQTYPQQGYPQQPYPPQPQMPYYPQPGYGYPQPPVQVNVVQNAGGAVVVQKGVNHALHAVLTFLTGGLWLFVWIPLALGRRKKVVYYR